jgi:two-component system OmpR family sensor kinase
LRAPFSSLYLRMAIHIGAALGAFVIIGAASLGLIAAWELRGYIETRHSSLGEEAAAILAERGEPGLITWLRTEAEIPADVTVYVLDSASRDILGRDLPDQYADFIRNSVVGSPEEPGSNYQPVRLAPRLIGPDGRQYAFLLMPKGISLWGSPATALGLLAAALLVIASVAWLIARAFSRPIAALQLAVRELASGNTTAHAPAALTERGDELGALAVDFNSMATQLNDLLHSRENLLREMSHELRSPLARLQAALTLAVERDRLDKDEFTKLEAEIDRMSRVIGEMLRYSRLDASVPPKKRLVRIGKLLRELAEVEEVEAQKYECKLALNVERDLTVIGDPELLLSGFENVLRNAIRYAPAGSSIDISAAKETTVSGQDIVVVISDRGPGVAAEHLDKIFEPYFRVSSGAHHPDSTGLGLAIVRRVATNHAGTVYAARREGGGLTVTLRLPAAELS